MLGDGLLLLAVAMTVYLTAVMRYRTGRIVNRAGYMRVFRVEMALCACMLALALDARFGMETLLRVELLAWAVRLAALAALVPACVLAVLIASRLWEKPEGDVENIVVLGLALERGQPPRELIHRLETARGYALAHPQTQLIVSGGNGGGSRKSEAEVMRDYLCAKGIDGARIRLEDQSSDTIENITNVAHLVDPAAPALLVTSGYHILRASGLACNTGFRTVLRFSTRCEPIFLPANIAWEVVCIANNLLTGHITMRNLANALKSKTK